jgi:prepilin-type N-terminal cleavage/methylation domain-containing protein
MKKFRAFTLIELLVVIAIFAILAALLLPVLSRAKNQGAEATDLNNLHRIMIALHLYSDDNNGMLTWPNWDYGGAMPDGTARAGWLYTPNLAATGTNIFNGRTGLLWDSLPGGKVQLCPMDRPGKTYYSAGGEPSQRAQQLSSYIMNGAVSGFRSGFYSNAPAVKISQMRAADCVLFEADDGIPFCFNDGSSWPSEGLGGRHHNGGMIAAADGSSSYMRLSVWEGEVADTHKNRLWCYPNTADGGDPV